MAFPIPRLPPVISATLPSTTPTMLAAMFLSLLTTLEFDIKGFWEIFDPATTLLSQLATVVIRLKRGVRRLHLMSPLPKDVTQLLLDWSNGNKEAVNKLIPLVYNQLRGLANHYLRRERPNHTLQATALIHEAYLRLVDQTNVHWQNRAHFFGIAANLMRQILVNHALSHNSAKRGGGAYKLSLDEAVGLSKERDVDLVALDEALTRLAALDSRQGRIVELRFFGGLTIEETAEVLGISPATVKREWTTAKAWLYREISRRQ
jgi:RNA polymerase sigma factor (TIGR02999 family)